MMEPMDDSTETAGAQPIRRLQRRTEGRLIAGVASGLGDYFGVDLVLFRIGFIVLTVLGGAGLLLYLVAWALIPSTDTGRSLASGFLTRFGGVRSLVGLGLLAAAVYLVAQQVGIWQPTLLWALVLIAIGVVLLREDGAAPVTRPTTVAAPPADAATVRIRRRRRAERSPLIWFTLGALLTIVPVVAILDSAGVVALDVSRYAPLALLIVAAGLIAGAWWGRSRLLIVLGIVMVPIVIGSSLVDFPLEGRVGGNYIQPESTSGLEDSYRLLFGRTTIDLLHTEFATRQVDLEVDIAIGELAVIVPRDTAVELNGSLQAGSFSSLHRYEDGTNLELSGRYGPKDAEKILNLHVDGGIASLSIQTYRPYSAQREKRQARIERRRQQRRREQRAEKRRDAARAEKRQEGNG